MTNKIEVIAQINGKFIVLINGKVLRNSKFTANNYKSEEAARKAGEKKMEDGNV